MAKGPDGPLVAIRLASSPQGPGRPTKGLAGHFDDLQLIRFAEPPASLELDITQDEARLVVGDQLFGTIRQADAERVSMTVDGEPVSLPWSDVSGVYFRRAAGHGCPVEGLLVRVEWRSAPGDDPENIDFAEGALTAVSDQAVTLATPYAGMLSIPRAARARSWWCRGKAAGSSSTRRRITSATSFPRPSPLDPPQPEGGTARTHARTGRVSRRPVLYRHGRRPARRRKQRSE